MSLLKVAELDTPHAVQLDQLIDALTGVMIDQVFTLGNSARFNGPNPWYDLQGRGAKGDGVTGDSTSINATVLLAEATGGTVWGGPAVFLLNAPITQRSTIQVKGVGWGGLGNTGGTVFKLANGVNDFAFKWVQASGNVAGAIYENFTIDGNCANQTAGGGITAPGAVEFMFDRLHFMNCYDDGIKMAVAPSTGLIGHHCHIKRCLFDSPTATAGKGRAIYLPGCDETWVTFNNFEGCGGSIATGEGFAIHDDQGSNHYMGNTYVSGQGCIIIVNTQRFSIVGEIVDGPNNDAFYISGNNGRGVITGCYMFGINAPLTRSAVSGVHLFFTTNVLVTGNVIEQTAVTNAMRSCVREENTTDHNMVTNNLFLYQGTAVSVSVVEIVGANTVVKGNKGFVTENSGTASVSAGTAPTVVVSHGLAQTPTLGGIAVWKTAAIQGGTDWWWDTPTATQFTIHIAGTTTGPVTFGFYARGPNTRDT